MWETSFDVSEYFRCH